MSAARQKGTSYENHIRDTYLTTIWPDVSRAPLKGNADWGDFINVSGWMIEARNRNRWDIPNWIRNVYARMVKGNKITKPWVIVFKGDKRSDLKEDYVVAPAWLFFALVRDSKLYKEDPF